MGEETDVEGLVGAVAAKVIPSAQFFTLGQKACGYGCDDPGTNTSQVRQDDGETALCEKDCPTRLQTPA